MTKYYAGIGSRETPSSILTDMMVIASILHENGYILNSGGADGADTAFEKGAGELKQIFLPWRGFNDRVGLIRGNSRKAKEIAKSFIGHWDNMSQGAQKLHTRNVFQVLGEDLNTPVEFVICWTKDGKATGGTATAVKIAEHHGIKVYNLKNEEFPIDKYL